MASWPFPVLLGVQATAALASVAVLAAWPPRSGRLLLIPLTADSARDLVRAAIDGDALLLGRGPFQGSQVVFGNRAAIARRLPWAVVIATAPPGGCGADTQVEVTT